MRPTSLLLRTLALAGSTPLALLAQAATTLAPPPTEVDQSHRPSTGLAARLKVVPDDQASLKDALRQDQTRAYGFRVPDRGTLVVRLRHPKESLFVVHMFTPDGRTLAGMRTNMTRAQKQAVRFENTEGKPVDVVVLVIGPPRNSSDAWIYEEPYELSILREPMK